MRTKQTPRLPGSSPGLAHIANIPNQFQIDKQLEAKLRDQIKHPTGKKKSDSSQMQIRGNKGKRSNPHLYEDLKTPTPGRIHLDFRNRGDKNVKHGGGSLPEVNQENARNVIQDVNKEVMDTIDRVVEEEKDDEEEQVDEDQGNQEDEDVEGEEEEEEDEEEKQEDEEEDAFLIT
ncbi:glutamic acid-rich protein-like [Papaver somniferum]|uniref:glutamic acid-rich protein-like n=1 Tax=Papaver somniferum TaxID=3469 RepID=UPI000E700B50|nr:glutamic acid-rich protein-like [Papaver somniferum]